jgi:hypothetical protein
MMKDLNLREKLVSACLVIAILWLGLFPQPVFNIARPALKKTLNNQKDITILNRTVNSDDAFTYLLPPSQPSPTGEGADLEGIAFPPWGKRERG